MPPYMTIECSFKKDDCQELVCAFYNAFCGDDVVFNGVFAWGCEADWTWEQIITWNQKKLDKNFVLGYTQKVSDDYRQVLLTVKPFSTCRLILFNRKKSIDFHCIVPEYEIKPENSEFILRACSRVWSQLPAQSIETYGELESSVGYAAIAAGRQPSTRLFSFIDYDDCTKKKYAQKYQIQRLERGYLLKPRK